VKFSGDLKTKTFYDQILASDITLGESEETKAAAQLLAEEGLTGFTDAWINELNLIAKRKNSAGGEEAIKKYASMMNLTLEEAEAVDYELVRRTVAAK
jgi:hypothetical protein